MSEDLIRRSDAVKKIKWWFDIIDLNPDILIDSIITLPTIEPKRGEWKPKNHHTDYCSNCGFEETQWRTADYNFCPSCGARMEGVDDEHTI